LAAGHFPTDAHGWNVRRSHLYEHGNPKEGYHPDWNTLIYNSAATKCAAIF